MWRDREAGLGEIAGAAPVPDWVYLLGRAGGLALALATLQALMMAAAVVVQLRMGYRDIKPGLHLRLFLRLGTPGDYLTGVVSAVAYMGSLALAAPLAFGKPMVEKSSDLVALAITAIFRGLVIGHSWFRRQGAVDEARSQPGPVA